MNDSVDVVIPYAPSITPQEMLDEAVASVKSQSVDTELIIVEDTDERGPSWARNRGIERSERQLVAFLDADDLWKEHKLGCQLERMAETGAGLCVEGNPQSVDEFVTGLLTGQIASKTSSIVVNTEQISTRFNESLARFEDHLFMIEAAAEGDVCFCEDLIEIRKHDDGLSARGDTEMMYRQRQKMASLLADNENVSESIVEKFRRDLHYRSAVQFRKESHFSKAAIANLRSLRCGISFRNLRAAAALPAFILLEIINRHI